MDVEGTEATARFAAEVERVKASGMLGRSGSLNRLFDYLAERSSDADSPKEIDIALEVFGRTDTFDVSQDASVRVYIHRLRAKLEGFYEGSAEDRDRLLIPRGEYRLVLRHGVETGASTDADEGDTAAVDPAPDPVGTVAAPAPRGKRRALIAGLLLLLVAAGVLGGYLAGRNVRDAAPEIAATPTWAPILGAPRLTFVVLGDYYIFGETAGSFEVQRLVREFGINSPSDLDQYLMSHPDEALRFADLDLHYLPVSAAPALSNVLSVFNAGRRAGFGPGVTTMSQIAPDVVKTSNVVYVGYLSGLGLLRDLLFRVSSFSVGATYDEIVDRKTGKRYQSDWSSSANNVRPHLDYAYLASFNGPTGNRIVIISGTRDSGVVQASENATNPALLRDLAKRAGSDAFEVLFEVSTLGHVNVGSRLIAVRPLSASATSPAGGFGAEKFPDEARAGVQHPPAER